MFTFSFDKFFVISALTPIAEKYSSKKIRTNFFGSSDPKIKVKSLSEFLVVLKKLQYYRHVKSSSAECILLFSCSLCERATSRCSAQNFSLSGEDSIKSKEEEPMVKIHNDVFAVKQQIHVEGLLSIRNLLTATKSLSSHAELDNLINLMFFKNAKAKRD
jgi:hypothetical protein